MAILIVDDENRTREALRNLLSHLGHPVILETKNGEEALRMVQLEKSRIKLIIADLEMPYMNGISLVEKVNELSHLDLCPFLLITSDLLTVELAEYRKKQPRLDACLVKPFRMNALAEAMEKAYLHRCTTRSRILYVGDTPPILHLALQKEEMLWSDLRSCQPSELISLISNPSPPYPGLILIEPGAIQESDQILISQALYSFKKTPLGTITPVVCLSREPKQIFHFRTICRFFWEYESTPLSWSENLRTVQKYVLTGWKTDLLFQTAKNQLQSRELNAAWKTVRKMLKLNSDHCDIQNMAGDILELMDQSKKAIHHYQEVLRLNPTLPGPYIKLLRFHLKADRDSALQFADSAIQFCPHNTDVLDAVKRTYADFK